MGTYIYLISFIFFFAINLKVLMALHVETIFKKGHVWEIKTFILIVSVAISHMLAILWYITT